jgi:dienelactone hydrolase
VKTALKVIVTLIVLAGAGTYGYLYYSAQQGYAAPAAAALAAMESDSQVTVQDGDWVVMRPASTTPTRGVIVYPGAYCDVRGYAPLMRPMAAAGWLVVGVKMPLNLSLLAPGRADKVRAAYPEIDEWVMVGHSLGGSMVGVYASEHPGELAGVIFWDSYPPESNSLADQNMPAVHIHRATLDGEPPEKFKKMRATFPPDNKWVPVPGGIHMYFGAFDGGGYNEEWTPKISNEAQLELATAATLAALERMQ